MKVYHYDAYGPDGNVHVALTEDEVLLTYLEFWVRCMELRGKRHLISVENCLEDYKIVNWAWVVDE